MELDDAIQDQPNEVDAALNAPEAQPEPTFDDHLNAFQSVLNAQTHGFGSTEDRWDPSAAGSIARRDYFDLGAGNVESNPDLQMPGDVERAAGLRNYFGNTTEADLIAKDVNPTGRQPARQDLRFANFPNAPRSVVNPPRLGQYGPGNVSNKPKFTPATLPNAFQGQTPIALDIKPIKTVSNVRSSFPKPPR
jgi:hypothetical protein